MTTLFPYEMALAVLCIPFSHIVHVGLLLRNISFVYSLKPVVQKMHSIDKKRLFWENLLELTRSNSFCAARNYTPQTLIHPKKIEQMLKVDVY